MIARDQVLDLETLARDGWAQSQSGSLLTRTMMLLRGSAGSPPIIGHGAWYATSFASAVFHIPRHEEAAAST